MKTLSERLDGREKLEVILSFLERTREGKYAIIDENIIQPRTEFQENVNVLEEDYFFSVR